MLVKIAQMLHNKRIAPRPRILLSRSMNTSISVGEFPAEGFESATQQCPDAWAADVSRFIHRDASGTVVGLAEFIKTPRGYSDRLYIAPAHAC